MLNEEDDMKKVLVATALMLLVAAFPAVALGAVPDSPSCFGAAAADLAQSSKGAMGDHASSFGEPRLGIGNVAYLFTGTHQPGLLAGALGFDCP
jgi:hypothetical protein